MSSRSDPLLNEWWMHHLHLGAPQPGQPFVQRTGDVLFVYVTNEHVHFIDVLPHGAWADDRLLETLRLNWPHLMRPLEGVTAAEPLISPAMRLQARKIGLNFPIQTPDGNVYFPPGGGLVGRGHSLTVRRQVDRLLTRAFDLQQACVRQASKIAQALESKAGRPLRELHLALRPNGHELLIEETKSKLLFRVD